MLIALEVVREIFYSRGLDVVVTSANDSTHKEGSYHYQGRAFDFRTKHAPGIIKGMAAEIKQVLGPLGFDVVFEDESGLNEHLHIELDKRAGY
jgi:hypothetical protein